MAKKWLVVVDYKVDFVVGALGFPKAATLEGGIDAAVRSALQAGETVVFTRDTHCAQEYLSSREGRHLPVPHCDRGSGGWHLYGKLAAYEQGEWPGVHFVDKESFGGLGFAKLLADGAPDAITLVGVVTNMCVISNAVVLQTLCPQAEITVDASLCAGLDDRLHDEALAVMQRLQMNVINR